MSVRKPRERRLENRGHESAIDICNGREVRKIPTSLSFSNTTNFNGLSAKYYGAQYRILIKRQENGVQRINSFGTSHPPANKMNLFLGEEETPPREHGFLICPIPSIPDRVLNGMKLVSLLKQGYDCQQPQWVEDSSRNFEFPEGQSLHLRQRPQQLSPRHLRIFCPYFESDCSFRDCHFG
jgi:hypothetical protein